MYLCQAKGSVPGHTRSCQRVRSNVFMVVKYSRPYGKAQVWEEV
jgi:hypothetical protein